MQQTYLNSEVYSMDINYHKAIAAAKHNNFRAYEEILSTIPEINNNPIVYKLRNKASRLVFKRGRRSWKGRLLRLTNTIPEENRKSFLLKLTELVTEGRLRLINPLPYFDLALSKRADVNYKDKDGKTVLHKLSEYFEDSNTNLDLIDLLIKNRADVNAKDSNGNTALYNSVIKGNFRLAGYLKQKGAKINIKNKQGFSPLTKAASMSYLGIPWQNDFEMVRLLLGYHIPEDISNLPDIVQRAIQNERARIARAQEWNDWIRDNPYHPLSYLPIFQWGKKVRHSKHRRNYSKGNAVRRSKHRNASQRLK